ncbi:zinc-binding dehydrogenase [Streptomyces sp. NPDC093149]|uniref:zinc-binding dehydrogenase n=1 Tax=Streptomyces sp. NPDC093149 TaxID=3366031 RepID=UPI00380FBDE8
MGEDTVAAPAERALPRCAGYDRCIGLGLTMPMLYGSLTGEPICVSEDPRYIPAGRRIVEVYWLGYWLPRLTDAERRQLGEDIVELMREGVIETSPGREYSLDEIGEAVAQAEQKGRQGKVFLVPGK